MNCWLAPWPHCDPRDGRSSPACWRNRCPIPQSVGSGGEVTCCASTAATHTTHRGSPPTSMRPRSAYSPSSIGVFRCGATAAPAPGHLSSSKRRRLGSAGVASSTNMDSPPRARCTRADRGGDRRPDGAGAHEPWRRCRRTAGRAHTMGIDDPRRQGLSRLGTPRPGDGGPRASLVQTGFDPQRLAIPV